MPKEWTLPSGMTLETLDAYAREHQNAARRACYARHPERVMKQRLVCAANLLHRQGVINDEERLVIGNTIEAVLANG